MVPASFNFQLLAQADTILWPSQVRFCNAPRHEIKFTIVQPSHLEGSILGVGIITARQHMDFQRTTHRRRSIPKINFKQLPQVDKCHLPLQVFPVAGYHINTNVLLVDGKVLSFGKQSHLGHDAGMWSSYMMEPVPIDEPVVQISAGYNHSLALASK
jgi:hypothetical protein